MTENLENLSAKETAFSNGAKIPLDEVFILANDVNFVGQILAQSSLSITAKGETVQEAINRLTDKALNYIANALVDLNLKKGQGVTATARLALVAVPIAKDEISPVNTLFRYSQNTSTVPSKFFFTPKEARGSAGLPTLETRFISLEDAKSSACVQAFKAKTSCEE